MLRDVDVDTRPEGKEVKVEPSANLWHVQLQSAHVNGGDSATVVQGHERIGRRGIGGPVLCGMHWTYFVEE